MFVDGDRVAWHDPRNGGQMHEGTFLSYCTADVALVRGANGLAKQVPNADLCEAS